MTGKYVRVLRSRWVCFDYILDQLKLKLSRGEAKNRSLGIYIDICSNFGYSHQVTQLNFKPNSAKKCAKTALDQNQKP